jgi:hypothetical protein
MFLVLALTVVVASALSSTKVAAQQKQLHGPASLRKSVHATSFAQNRHVPSRIAVPLRKNMRNLTHPYIRKIKTHGKGHTYPLGGNLTQFYEFYLTIGAVSVSRTCFAPDT